MSALEQYNRDNKYVNSLQKLFDEYIEIDEDKIEETLNSISLIIDDELEQPKKHWWKVFEDNDSKNQALLISRFSKEVKQKHHRYKIFLRRFVEEHLMYKEAIIFTLKNQIKYIKDVLRRLETNYFEKPEDDFDKFIFKFRDVSFDLLEELAQEIKTEYEQYLIEADLSGSETILSPKDDIDFTTTVSKVLLLNELGIIDFIRNQYPSLAENNTHLAKVLSKFTAGHPDTIRKNISHIKTGRQDDPYNREQNKKLAENLFNTYNLNQKGE